MIGCFSLARETFDIEFAKKKLSKTKKLLTKLNKKIIFFDDLMIVFIYFFINIEFSKLQTEVYIFFLFQSLCLELSP